MKHTNGSLRQPRAPLTSAFLLVALLLALPVRAEQKVDETRPASATGSISIENTAGAVTVEGWDREEVTVRGTLGDDAELIFERDGERTRIEVKLPSKRFRLHSHEGSDLTIQAPRGSELDVQTVSADIHVSKIDGEVSASTVSGDLQVTGAPRTIQAEAVSGRVDIEAETSRVEAQSVSGDVLLRGSGGEVEISSVSGDVRIEGGRYSRVSAEAVSGKVLFDAAVDPTGRYEFSSHSGTVELRLPGDISAELDLETFSGDIESDFGGEAERTSRYTPGRELSTEVGKGEARISANSFSGSVRVVKK